MQLTCIPCANGASLFNDSSRNYREFNRRLDTQHIGIEKIRSEKLHIDYQIVATIRDNDPRHRSRSIVVGTFIGVVRLYKETGKICVVYPIMLDNGQVLDRAKSVLIRAHQSGSYPDKTVYASG